MGNVPPKTHQHRVMLTDLHPSRHTWVALPAPLINSRIEMKHLLLTTIAAVVLVGCGESQPTEPPTAKAPDISIHEAAMRGNIEAVKQHLDAGANVNAMRGGGTPLHLAASWGHKEVAELLIDNGADVNVKSGFGQTPLHWACNEGRHVAELLITKGADVNAIDAAGQTPLDWAEEEKQTETANLLRKHGGKTGKELEAEGK